MVGQKRILETVKEQIANKVFPKFAILHGERGSEQIELCEEIGKALGATTMYFGSGIDNVREMLDNAYSNSAHNHLYVLTDGDNMSVGAKNALLKVTEEPPKNAYIIMLIEDINNALETIRSRGVTYVLDGYTSSDLYSYAMKKGYSKDINDMLSICSTPGEVDMLAKYDVTAFKTFATKTFENIHVVQGANAFKIAKSINLSDDDSKYDLRLFWKMFIYLCYLHIERGGYAEAIKITLSSMRQLRISGINKQSLFDLWILDIRECWLYADH